jgi:hypothetical protein
MYGKRVCFQPVSMSMLVFSAVSLLRLTGWDREVRLVFLKKNHSQHHPGFNCQTLHRRFVSVLCILAWTYTYRHRHGNFGFYIVCYTCREFLYKLNIRKYWLQIIRHFFSWKYYIISDPVSNCFISSVIKNFQFIFMLND